MLRTVSLPCLVIFFFFNDTATTEIYTLSLHDALPISWCDTSKRRWHSWADPARARSPNLRSRVRRARGTREDRKSTRLNSSHLVISYAVFCLKKKKKTTPTTPYATTTRPSMTRLEPHS